MSTLLFAHLSKQYGWNSGEEGGEQGRDSSFQQPPVLDAAAAHVTLIDPAVMPGDLDAAQRARLSRLCGGDAGQDPGTSKPQRITVTLKPGAEWPTREARHKQEVHKP